MAKKTLLKNFAIVKWNTASLCCCNEACSLHLQSPTNVFESDLDLKRNEDHIDFLMMEMRRLNGSLRWLQVSVA